MCRKALANEIAKKVIWDCKLSQITQHFTDIVA